MRAPPVEDATSYDKLTTSKLAQKLGMRTADLLVRLSECGYLEPRGDRHYITARGKEAGGEFRTGSYGPYFLWPETVDLTPV